MSLSITFLGAAQNVTGSSYLVEAGADKVLVDCGLYQERDFRARNWVPFPALPASLKAVLLTHAHLDHCGLLPKLVCEGFQGPIYCTPATADLAKIVLLDSAKIQEEDAATKARRHEQEGRQGPHPDVPLYTARDAEAVLPHLTPVAYGVPVPVAPGIQATFSEAGHILGSAMISLALSDASVTRSLLFTGDLGRHHLPILRDPALCHAADYVVMESTYGDRVHGDMEAIPTALMRIVRETRKAGGKLVIPAFAIERTQELIYHLNGLFRAKKIQREPVFVDSPMAIRVTEVFSRHPELFDEETRALMGQGAAPYACPGMQVTASVEDSKAINRVHGPAIIIAGSGMCNAGRIKHHLAKTISEPENTILFVGYQSPGTLGREILDGAREVRIFGQWHPVRARVERLTGFSAHADRDELLTWLQAFNQSPRSIFVTHGEAATARSFAAFVHEKTGWTASAPAYHQRELLT